MKRTLLAFGLLLASGTTLADVQVSMHRAEESGPGAPVGTVTLKQTKHGVVFTPALEGLAPGLHGFHVHEHGSCDAAEKDGRTVPAQAAGGHYDPDKTGRHGTPWGDGHRGDLPPLHVATDGTAAQPVLAPRLTLKELAGRSLMVHAGGDNHADHPAPLGGGGARVACGVIPGKAGKPTR